MKILVTRYGYMYGDNETLLSSKPTQKDQKPTHLAVKPFMNHPIADFALMACMLWSILYTVLWLVTDYEHIPSESAGGLFICAFVGVIAGVTAHAINKDIMRKLSQKYVGWYDSIDDDWYLMPLPLKKRSTGMEPTKEIDLNEIQKMRKMADARIIGIYASENGTPSDRVSLRTIDGGKTMLTEKGPKNVCVREYVNKGQTWKTWRTPYNNTIKVNMDTKTVYCFMDKNTYEYKYADHKVRVASVKASDNENFDIFVGAILAEEKLMLIYHYLNNDGCQVSWKTYKTSINAAQGHVKGN